MSRNKHTPSLDYLYQVLGSFNKCPKRQCKGTLIPVLCQYESNGVINYEEECSSCGKIIKDKRFREERMKRWKQNQKRQSEYNRRPDETKSATSRFR